jgi:hypothetical protein
MRDDRGGHNPLVENALSSLILTAAVFGGGALRLFNLNWDQGYLFHPDERMILMTIGELKLPWPPNWDVLLSPASPLNPHFFAYGSLPLYLLKVVAHVLALSPILSTYASLVGEFRGYLTPA